MNNINVPPRPFKVGDEVVCFLSGKISSVSYGGARPILINFDSGIETYTEQGKREPESSHRCLFHADENVKITVTEPVYEYQILHKLKDIDIWAMSNFHYKTAEDFESDLNLFEGDLNKYESIELFLPSKRLVKND